MVSSRQVPEISIHYIIERVVGLARYKYGKKNTVVLFRYTDGTTKMEFSGFVPGGAVEKTNSGNDDDYFSALCYLAHCAKNARNNPNQGAVLEPTRLRVSKYSPDYVMKFYGPHIPAGPVPEENHPPLDSVDSEESTYMKDEPNYLGNKIVEPLQLTFL